MIKCPQLRSMEYCYKNCYDYEREKIRKEIVRKRWELEQRKKAEHEAYKQKKIEEYEIKRLEKLRKNQDRFSDETVVDTSSRSNHNFFKYKNDQSLLSER